jgi:hypothetical protein
VQPLLHWRGFPGHVMQFAGLGVGFVIVGLTLAHWGGRAISTQGKATIDPRILIGSGIALVGFVMTSISTLVWLLGG